MWASWKGHHDIVRTLLVAEATDVNAQNNVRNQMMMMMMIIILLLTILMMMLMMMMIVIDVFMLIIDNYDDIK
jgi:cell division septal protein FtsQ